MLQEVERVENFVGDIKAQLIFHRKNSWCTAINSNFEAVWKALRLLVGVGVVLAAHEAAYRRLHVGEGLADADVRIEYTHASVTQCAIRAGQSGAEVFSSLTLPGAGVQCRLARPDIDPLQPIPVAPNPNEDTWAMLKDPEPTTTTASPTTTTTGAGGGACAIVCDTATPSAWVINYNYIGCSFYDQCSPTGNVRKNCAPGTVLGNPSCMFPDPTTVCPCPE
nr:uncharacterized protein LOC113821726 [Penaeus vannamei]